MRPAQARAELLPDGFTFDPGSSWIKAVQFGKNIAIEAERAKAQAATVLEKQRKEQEAANALGFSDAETARHLAEIPDNELRGMLAERERRRSVILPEHEPANPSRRSERVFSHALTSPQRRTEERTRSVSVGRDLVKQEASQYLTQQYTNADAQQICQVCKDELPFKLDDGSHYFETVELIEGLSRWHAQNYLCLCPNHSAMFQHANASKSALRRLVVEASRNEIDVILGQNPHSIYFTRTHLSDLRTRRDRR